MPPIRNPEGHHPRPKLHATVPGWRSSVRVEQAIPSAGTDRQGEKSTARRTITSPAGTTSGDEQPTARDRRSLHPAPWCVASPRTLMADEAVFSHYNQCDENASNPSLYLTIFD